MAVAGFVVVMGLLHFQDPRSFGVKGPKEGKQYFYPSEAITANGKFIPARTLMMDDYCLKCHKDAYDGWFHSAHHFSSFNNKAYLTSVRETRTGRARARRLDPGRPLVRRLPRSGAVLLGRIRRPELRRREQPDQPGRHHLHDLPLDHQRQQHPRQRRLHDRGAPALSRSPISDNPLLQWINNTLVKAKPEMHKKTFLKPIIKDAKFCSTCHKVGLPVRREPLQGFRPRPEPLRPVPALGRLGPRGAELLLSRRWPRSNCIECHMELKPSTDFGARDFDGKGGREIHDHLFSAPTPAWPTILGDKETAERHAQFLSDKKVRIDIFGLREGGVIDGKLLGPAPARGPDARSREASTWSRSSSGRSAIGHLFSQGTVDSNEIWVELIATLGRPGHRPLRRASGPTARSIPTRISSTSTCSTATATGSTAATRKTSSSRSTTSRFPRAPARSSTSASRSPRARPARSRSRPRSTIASSTAPTSTTSSARGRGPSCRSS